MAKKKPDQETIPTPAKPLGSLQFREMPVADLRPAPYNPRDISETALAGLRESIRRWGYVDPIIWNEATGHVIGGNQRLKVLQESGVEKAQVVVVNIPDMAEEKALNVALNNPGIQGTYTDDVDEILTEIENLLPDVYDMVNMKDVHFDRTAEDIEKPPEEEKIIPEMELLPFESYDYVVFLFRNSMDFDFISEKLGMENVNASRIPSKKKIGLGRCLNGKILLELLKND